MIPYDPFQNPLLYLVRHGSTEANETGKFRGHRDYPLDDEGFQAADEAAYFLSFRPVGFVASSTLTRAVQTASAIAPALQLSFDRNPGLLPWNIGQFAGKSREQYKSQLEWYVKNPDAMIPEGESLTEFQRRFSEILFRYLAQASHEQPGVLVTHSSGITAAHVAFEQDCEGKGPGLVDIVEPGGIVGVFIGLDDKPQLRPLLGEIVNDSSTTFT
ncbi:MAG TPA: histidine phosphatase family protein [Candidatus Angelobacter sp.]|jgi:broad specificity phosphatase PhoE|nr:histidine phosphatase family protein [Candidatus Angelobacter sp.]